jgi:uncharacterized RDD family membrane protein YckC
VSQLVTGEAVALELREAALPSRMLAALIDGAIQLVLLLALVALLSAFPAAGSAALGVALVIVIVVVVGLGYPVTFETLMRGRTPGKAAMGLRVVRDDAGPIGFRQAFVRGLIGFVVERPGITSFAAAMISSLLSSRGKRLGDLAAGTVVIQERVATATGPVAQMPPPLAGWAGTLDLTHLSDELAQSVRSFVARAPQLTDAARTDLGHRLTGAVAAVVSPPPPPGTPGWAYLSAVLAERRLRAERALQARQPPPSYAAAPGPVAPPPPYPAPPPPEPPPGGFALPS